MVWMPKPGRLSPALPGQSQSSVRSAPSVGGEQGSALEEVGQRWRSRRAGTDQQHAIGARAGFGGRDEDQPAIGRQRVEGHERGIAAEIHRAANPRRQLQRGPGARDIRARCP